MKSQTVILLWIIAIVLGIVACIIKFGSDDENQTRSRLAPGELIIANLPIREITKVSLSQGGENTTLVRIDDNEWVITERDNYPIDYELLRNLLGALSELTVTQGYPAGDKHHVRFGLASDNTDAINSMDQALAATIFRGENAVVEKVYLGKILGTSRNGGRFIRLGSDAGAVYTVNETFPGVSASPRDWISKDFLKIDQIESIKVTAPADPHFTEWQLIRQPKTDGSPNPEGQFQLADLGENEVMQLTSTNTFRNLFAYSNVVDVISDAQASEVANPDPKLKRQVTIRTHDGLNYVLNMQPLNEQPPAMERDDRLPPTPSNYLLTIGISSDVSENSPASHDKTSEESAGASGQDASTQQRLVEAKSLTGRIFQVSHSTIAAFLMTRSDFAKKTTTAPKKTAGE